MSIWLTSMLWLSSSSSVASALAPNCAAVRDRLAARALDRRLVLVAQSQSQRAPFMTSVIGV